MPAQRLFTNNASSTLASSIGAGDVSIVLAAGTGVKFPSPASGINIAVLTICDAAETVFEDIAVTSRAVDTLTVVRGYDSSTARAWAAGDKVQLRVTAQHLQWLVFGPDVEGWAMTSFDGAKIGAGTGGAGNTVFGVNSFQYSSGHTFCTAMGQNSQRDLSSGDYNTSFGAYSGTYNTTGNNNSSFGYASGAYTAAATYNTCIGSHAGELTTGSNNTYVGAWAAGVAGAGDNNTVLGAGANKAAAGDSNSVTLGNASVTVLRCQVTSITALSDERDKADIEPLTFGRHFIDTLRPVSFTWNMRDGGKVGVPDCGFIAQELQTAQEVALGADILNLVYASNPDKLEASYGRLLPVMVKAIQELSTALASAEARLAALEGK